MSNPTINIKDTAEAVKGIVEAVPVYEDVIQPAAKEIGKGLQTVAKTVHIALAPISALVWGYEKICDYISNALEERLKNIPPENIVTPDPMIAGPILESLRFVGHKEDLRELFANLLATAMNSKVAQNAHPSFVEIIKQLSPDEARIIKHLDQQNYIPLINLHRTDPNITGEITIYRNFSLIGEQAGCVSLELVPSYLDNLQRLGLIGIPEGRHLTQPEKYKALENHPFMLKKCSEIKNQNFTPIMQQKYFFLTTFGIQFYKACI